MMKRDWELLFSEYDLRRVLENQLKSVDLKVRALGDDRFESKTNDFLSASIASELVVPPVRLLENQISVSSREAKIDVSYDRDRHFSGPGPHYMDGLEVTYHVPFTGDGELLRCRPGRFTMNPPRGVITGSELAFPYDRADREIAATKKDFGSDLSSIKQWLEWQDDEIRQYNESLEGRVLTAVQARRSELSKTKSDLASLGYAIRGEGRRAASDPTPPPDVAKRRAAKREEAAREYDVALSFAGEDRDYVEEVAKVLTEVQVTVFYDRFETVNLWGKDLAVHLGKVYSEASQFVVMFASRYYAEKAWPNHERQFALSRHLTGLTGRILPVRIDGTEIPGVPPTIGYLDARVLTPSKLAELIRQKLDAEL